MALREYVIASDGNSFVFDQLSFKFNMKYIYDVKCFRNSWKAK